jgi:hypothetical protein
MEANAPWASHPGTFAAAIRRGNSLPRAIDKGRACGIEGSPPSGPKTNRIRRATGLAKLVHSTNHLRSATSNPKASVTAAPARVSAILHRRAARAYLGSLPFGRRRVFHKASEHW